MTMAGQLQSSSTAAYLIAVGFVSIFGQVVVLRELSVSFYGIELIYVLSLGLWLLGTALGAVPAIPAKDVCISSSSSLRLHWLLTSFSSEECGHCSTPSQVAFSRFRRR
jgi:hypothetical protein